MQRFMQRTTSLLLILGLLEVSGSVVSMGQDAIDEVGIAQSEILPGLERASSEPRISGRVDALLLWRSPSQAVPLFTDVATGETAIDAAGFGSPMAAGPRYALFFHGAQNAAWEANYLRVQGFQSARALPQQGSKYQVANLLGQNWETIDSVSGGYSAGLQSFELNARLPTDQRWQWLVGFRWVEWRETMLLSDTYSVGGISGTDFFDASTCNDLYGGQVGIDATILDRGGRFTVDGIVKAGLFGNAATQTSLYETTEPPNTFTAGPVSRAKAATSFVGELGVSGVYRLTDWCSLRAGYTIFWISGVAMAPNQLPIQSLDFVDPTASITAINVGGSVVAQGLSLGLEGRW